MNGFVSIPALHPWLRHARDRGVDCTPALRAAGIDPAWVEDPSRRITAEAFERLLSAVIPASGDSAFGLHAAVHVVPASYSVLGYIAMSCATLGEALAKVPAYEKIVGDHGTTSIESMPPGLGVFWSCRILNPEVRRHVVENVLASWTGFSRWIADSPAEAPVEVWFQHDSPGPAVMQACEDWFRSSVLFGKPRDGLVLAESQLAKPLRQADAGVLSALLEHATALLTRIDAEEPVSVRVSHLLRLMMRRELPRRESVAARLGMTTRTLQRKLADEGTGYQRLLDDLRQELAREYLRQRRLSIDAIGEALGFADPRSFHRVFKQWTGVTPGQYRDGSAASGS